MTKQSQTSYLRRASRVTPLGVLGARESISSVLREAEGQQPSEAGPTSPTMGLETHGSGVVGLTAMDMSSAASRRVRAALAAMVRELAWRQRDDDA